MKKSTVVKVIIVVLAVIFLFVCIRVFQVRSIFNGGEDEWIKDSRGIWIEHGHPLRVPESVINQYEAISCSLNLYEESRGNGTILDSQCLGTCKGYAVDIVHVPRTEEDSIAKNQCEDFVSGRVGSFIEMDSSGEIVRIVE